MMSNAVVDNTDLLPTVSALAGQTAEKKRNLPTVSTSSAIRSSRLRVGDHTLPPDRSYR